MMMEFINEEDDNDSGEGRIDMDDPVMQKTGWSKENPDLTVGGVLKQGEKHPEYKAAMDIVDKEKGGGDEKDDAGKLSGKSDFSRDGGDGDTKAEPEGGDKSADEPKGEPSAWSQKAQKAKDDLEQLSDPDEIGDWVEDNKWALSGGKLGRAADLEFKPVEKAYAELEDAYMEGDWDVYDKAKEDFTKLTNQKLDSQKVSRGTGKEESISINGKKYRPIKESKKPNKRVLKENYDRIFGDK